jgi:hypothetical protein
MVICNFIIFTHVIWITLVKFYFSTNFALTSFYHLPLTTCKPITPKLHPLLQHAYTITSSLEKRDTASSHCIIMLS